MYFSSQSGFYGKTDFVAIKLEQTCSTFRVSS